MNAALLTVLCVQRRLHAMAGLTCASCQLMTLRNSTCARLVATRPSSSAASSADDALFADDIIAVHVNAHPAVLLLP